jgi:hypothetical protein
VTTGLSTSLLPTGTLASDCDDSYRSRFYGDRGANAIVYHQLGNLAQDRGDYDTAEQHHQAALTIFEELGNRAGAAATLSQLGTLRTDQGRAADAVGYQVQSLAIHAELGLADDGHDLRMLREQRTALGDEQFQRILQTLLDTDRTATVMQLTETD